MRLARLILAAALAAALSVAFAAPGRAQRLAASVDFPSLLSPRSTTARPSNATAAPWSDRCP